MKNIAVLTVLVIILNSAYCENNRKNYEFSIGSKIGFIYGQSLELVYPVPGETKGELLSELRYDMKPVFYYGLQADFNRINLFNAPGFFASVSVNMGIPYDSGIHENRDWASFENDALTHFSRHTNKTRRHYLFDASMGVTVPVNSFIYFKPFIGGSWMHFAFTGRDGYGTYARMKGFNTYHPIDDNPIDYSFEGKEVIHYEQTWLLIYPGISVGIGISPFSFDFSFKMSLLNWCSARDEHIDLKTIYLDYTRSGLYYEPSLNISMNLKQVEVSLGASYRHIGRTSGITHKNMNDQGYVEILNKSGAGLTILDTRFLIRYRF